jgi:DNA mismatch repair protein MutS2
VDGSEIVPVTTAAQGAGAEAGGRTRAVSYSLSGVDPSDRPAFELDLRGMRLTEALAALEQQIDRAILAGITEFSVIHGMWEGVLQAGVRDYLHASRVVSAYRYSPPESGGSGKTIVILDHDQEGTDKQ